ncbi:hypothetical protein T484DRAFT_1981466 [Baffinella frigidus]|nr:hypothetical protein T484DRAFT_1981466 [Cryptophyta sp. CCMP2293]
MVATRRPSPRGACILICGVFLGVWGSFLFRISERESLLAENRHLAEQLSFLQSGGPSGSKVVVSKRTCPFVPPSNTEVKVQSNGGWVYTEAVIARWHVVFDDGFGTALSSFLGSASIYDIGAGVGQLAVLLAKKNSLVDYAGFDGGNNIQRMWGKLTPLRGDQNHVVPEICWIDAAVPVTLPKRSWVVSFEVGEHIPKKSEAQFLDNLVALCTEGVVVSWAIPGQPGRNHINSRSNAHIIAEMEKRGLVYDAAQATAFRDTVGQDTWWLKRSLMVFRREGVLAPSGS